MIPVEPLNREHAPTADRQPEKTAQEHRRNRQSRRRGAGLLGLGVLLVLTGMVGFGAWRHYSQDLQVQATAEQRRDFVPNVRAAPVRASNMNRIVSLPATTSAFSTANVFARSSGYIDKREVDIGDRVKQGQLLAEIVAPELDHQIAQAQGTLEQLKASVQQAKATLDLAQTTWNRDHPLLGEGWLTAQQGTVDVQSLKAQAAAVNVAQANLVAQAAQLQVLNQEKIYQRVVAPFDGVITQRNIDIGSLVQADAVNGTFMFTIMQGDVIRTQVFVPQDEAIGLGPGIDAVIRIPEIPNRTFSGKVTRIASALQPGTRTLLTEVDIPNPDGALLPGMYCTIELHIPRKIPSLFVPAEAIIFNADGLQVAVVENGVVRIRKIQVARDLGTQVEVREGVKAGDQVVLNPAVDLVEGSKVQIRR